MTAKKTLRNEKAKINSEIEMTMGLDKEVYPSLIKHIFLLSTNIKEFDTTRSSLAKQKLLVDLSQFLTDITNLKEHRLPNGEFLGDAIQDWAKDVSDETYWNLEVESCFEPRENMWVDALSALRGEG